jgi:predicted GNAT family acetyltransferase
MLNLDYVFLDVEENEDFSEELRNLYENRKLNFPTITIGEKKLRNPSDKDLIKWIDKLIPKYMEITHDKENKSFTLDIGGEVAKVEYVHKDNKLFLVHSEVPKSIRGKGIGKILVEKTFEKLTDEGYRAIAVCSYVKAVAKRSEKWNKIIG